MFVGEVALRARNAGSRPVSLRSDLEDVCVVMLYRGGSAAAEVECRKYTTEEEVCAVESEGRMGDTGNRMEGTGVVGDGDDEGAEFEGVRLVSLRLLLTLGPAEWLLPSWNSATAWPCTKGLGFCV